MPSFRGFLGGSRWISQALNEFLAHRLAIGLGTCRVEAKIARHQGSCRKQQLEMVGVPKIGVPQARWMVDFMDNSVKLDAT